MSAAGVAGIRIRRQRDSGSESRERSFTVVFCWLDNVLGMRALLGVGSPPWGQARALHRVFEHDRCHLPVVWAARAIGYSP